MEPTDSWGCHVSNFNGQLGTGDNTDQHAPVRVGLETDWASATAGTSHTAAVRTDGTLWAWGYNTRGQLGDDTTTDRWLPTPVGTGTSWDSVAAGSYHTVALRP